MAELTEKEREELIAEYKALKKDAEEKGWVEPSQSVAGKVMEEAKDVAVGGLKALDYQRALAQRALLDRHRALGGKDLLTEEEKGAIDPRNLQLAPGYGDILERQFGDFPGSQTIGFGLDVALDPLTWESGGLAALKKVPGLVAKLRKWSAGGVLAKIGEKMYRSPFRKADADIITNIGPGAKKFSDIVLEQGWTGNRTKIHENMNKYLDDLVEKQKQILESAGEAGITIDVKAAMDDARAYAKTLMDRANPEDANRILKKVAQIEEAAKASTPPAAPRMAVPKKPEMPSSSDVYLRPETVEKYNKDLSKYQDDLANYQLAQEQFQKASEEFIPLATPAQASGMKTEIWKEIPKGVFGKPVISESDVAGRIQIGGGLAKALENMPGYGEDLAKINQEMRPIFTAAPKEKLVLRQESNVPLVTGIDRNVAPLLLLGGGGGSPSGRMRSGGELAQWFLTKKLLDNVLQGSYVPTKLGSKMMKMGKSGLTSPLLKAGIIEGQPVSPWSLLPEEEQ